MIKFQGFGGEIGISRDQLQAVRQADAQETAGLNVSAPEGAQEPASRGPADKRRTEPSTTEKPVNEDQARSTEELEYRRRLAEITRELKEARTRYAVALRGTSSPDATQLITEEQIRARGADATSRFKDAQKNPSEPAPVKLLRPSPFSSLPPTVENHVAGQTAPNLGSPEPYTELERLFSDLRQRIVQLDKERDRLIKEMQEKNFDTEMLIPD